MIYISVGGLFIIMFVIFAMRSFGGGGKVDDWRTENDDVTAEELDYLEGLLERTQEEE